MTLPRKHSYERRGNQCLRIKHKLERAMLIPFHQVMETRLAWYFSMEGQHGMIGPYCETLFPNDRQTIRVMYEWIVHDAQDRGDVLPGERLRWCWWGSARL